MLTIEHHPEGIPEKVVRLSDPESGLHGCIVLHSTRLGPAAGGCRFWHYRDDGELNRDALRLAEGMAMKNAMAGLPLGGGKAVLQVPEGPYDRGEMFRAFGRAIEMLAGEYVTAEDVGTTVADMEQVARSTSHVAGLEPQDGRPGGDPSPWTALGVFKAMEVAVRHRLGRDLADVTVAVQGLGNVGYALCELLHGAGARLVVADTRSEVVARAASNFGAMVVSSASHGGVSEIGQVAADVWAPCALGGALSSQQVDALKAKVVCGAANNQLVDMDVADKIVAKGVLYAPDYLVNAGGIINVAAEYLGWDEAQVVARVNAIPERLEQVLDLSVRESVSPAHAANIVACQLIREGREYRDTKAA